MKDWYRRYFDKGVAAAIFFAVGVLFAYAANITPTPIVGPTETGEWSAMSQQVVDMARIKPGFGSGTAGGSASAATFTSNTAAGSATWPANLTIISNATATFTLTNSKVQAGDAALCMLDSTGAAAGSVPEVASVQVSAGQLVCVLTNASATSPAVAVKIYWLILTQGNPN